MKKYNTCKNSTYFSTIYRTIIRANASGKGTSKSMSCGKYGPSGTTLKSSHVRFAGNQKELEKTKSLIDLIMALIVCSRMG